MINSNHYHQPKVARFLWKNLTFEFRSWVSADFLYLASYNTLYLNNRILLKSGGFHFRESASGTFIDNKGLEHSIKFETRNLIDIWQPVTITIDGEIVYQGGTPIRGLLKAILLYFPIGFLIGIVLGKFLGILNIQFPG